MALRLILNEPQIAAILNSPEGPVARDLGRRAVRVESQAKVNASGRPGPQVQSGRLRSSIHWRLVVGANGIGGNLYAVVSATTSYARYVEYGTKAHVISPRTRQALYWKGARHPVRRVYHPGNKPYPFLRPALKAAL